MREKLLTKLAQLHSQHPWRMLAVVSLLTLLFLGLSTQLKVTLRWSDLLPENDPRTIQFNKIIDEFKSSTSIVVVVQGQEKEIKRFADYIAPKILAARDTTKDPQIRAQLEKLEKKLNPSNETEKKLLTINELKSRLSEPLVQRVDYKQELDFIKEHGLMLTKEDDLKNTAEVFFDPNISGFLYHLNNSLEKEYVGKAESISSREKEDQAFYFLDGLKNIIQLFTQSLGGDTLTTDQVQRQVDMFLTGEPYFLSYDKSALILNVVPTFPMTDGNKMVVGTDIVQSIVDKGLTQFPNVKAGLSGMIAIGHDEMIYTEKSLGYTSLIAFLAILALLIFSLRMWIAPVLAMINLLVGVVWAIGLTVIFVGQLNFMTSMMTVILFGLGIDFSIHLISGFTEWRALRYSILDSLERTLLTSGKGVITGALTTAFAFLTLIISNSRGMKELGIVTGLGLIAILCVTLLLLPSMLVLREKRLDKSGVTASRPRKDISFVFLGSLASSLGKNYPLTLAASSLATIALLYLGSQLTFDYNYMNIEPKGLTSIALQDTVIDKFDIGMDYALILANSIEESRELANKYRKMGSVATTEDISVYLPSDDQQKTRRKYVMQIRDKLSAQRIRSDISTAEMRNIIAELSRLDMNIMEIQDMAFIGGQDKVDNKCTELVGDPDQENPKNIIQDLINLINNDPDFAKKRLATLQQNFSPYFKETALQMANPVPIEYEQLPESILNRYTNDDRTQFLVTVFPAGNIWQDAKFLNQFVDDLESMSDKATGLPPVFRALIQVIGRDGRTAVLLTVIVVFLLLWFDFGSYKLSILAMIPLAVGIIWMIGLMYLTGQQLTIMNFIGLPMIVGIGIDDGVHIVHRWQTDGKGQLKSIFASTGKAIMLTSLTTMIAFGSLIFSIWRGFGQLGSALFVGVGACFLATIFILPAIIHWVDSKPNKQR